MIMRRKEQGINRDEPLVYVVDDDEGVRDSLRLLLKAVGLAGRAYSSATEFLDSHDPEQHGCLVADIRMPGMNGLELQDELNQRGAPIPLIFITGYGDVPMAVDAMQSGALDFIEKPFRDQDFLDRVHQALTWDKERRTENLKTLAIRERLATLTPRETEVMERVVQGQANKVIAIDLGISQRTVELHRSRVMGKMGVRSVAKLVRAVEAANS
jgi:FixJ family two-component response regulator